MYAISLSLVVFSAFPFQCFRLCTLLTAIIILKLEKQRDQDKKISELQGKAESSIALTGVLEVERDISGQARALPSFWIVC
jgi:hypothetical protein